MRHRGMDETERCFDHRGIAALRAAMAAAAVLTLAILSACGGSDSAGDNTDAETTAAGNVVRNRVLAPR